MPFRTIRRYDADNVKQMDPYRSADGVMVSRHFSFAVMRAAPTHDALHHHNSLYCVRFRSVTLDRQARRTTYFAGTGPLESLFQIEEQRPPSVCLSPPSNNLSCFQNPWQQPGVPQGKRQKERLRNLSFLESSRAAVPPPVSTSARSCLPCTTLALVEPRSQILIHDSKFPWSPRESGFRSGRGISSLPHLHPLASSLVTGGTDALQIRTALSCIHVLSRHNDRKQSSRAR